MLKLIEKAQSNNLSLWASNDKIKLSYGDEAPDATLMKEIKNNKAQLLQFLKNNNIVTEKSFRKFQKNRTIEAIYPANSLQQGFVFHHINQPQDDAYRVQLLMDYHEALNIEAYQQAWRLASVRYPALRMGFNWEKTIVQVIVKEATINEDSFSFMDISDLPQVERDIKIQQIQQQQRTIGFDLKKPGLMRFVLIKQHERFYTVLSTGHHIVMDGWSRLTLMQTVHDYYKALVQGKMLEPESEKAYLEAQAYYVKQQQTIDHYWSKVKQQFGAANDINVLLNQAIDLTQTKIIEHVAEQRLIMSGDDFYSLKTMCQQQSVTLNVTLQFAWHKLLHNYTQDEQTIVGTTVSGRDIPVEDIESSVGLYINTLPLVVNWKNSATATELLTDIQGKIAELNSYSSVPLAKLQSHGERLFHSLFVFENYPSPVNDNDSAVGNSEGAVQFRQIIEKTDYPLSIVAYDEDDSLVLRLIYNKDYLSETHAERLLVQIQRILNSIAVRPEQAHEQISLADEYDLQKYQVLNQTGKSYGQPPTLTEKIFSWRASNENAIAVAYEDQSYSYKVLDERSNQIAHLLRAQGAQRNQLIGVFIERGIEFMAAIFGILKSGAAYVPIDPGYPPERIRSMLEQCAFDLVISQNTLLTSLKKLAVDALKVVVCVDHYHEQPGTEEDDLLHVMDKMDIETASKDHCNIVNQLDDLAYVIFTSGSTGLPKGVQVTHQNIYNMSQVAETFNTGPEDKVLQFAPLCFDVSVGEIFPILSVGGQVHILPAAKRQSPKMYLDTVTELGITVITMTPSYFYHLIELAASNKDKFSSLKTVIVGGEPLLLSQINKWKAIFGDDNKIYNVYGPTETTVLSSYYSVEATVDDFREVIVLGKPINNTKIYIVDEQHRLCPVNQCGEIVIGGDGVTRGYLNDEKKTAQVYIDKLDNGLARQRYYKSGDMGRLLADGNIEFLGRKDSQVKIRGFRVELGEIENALNELPDVKQSVVIDRERDGSRFLAAYIVSVANTVIDCDNLYASLSVKLPDYMLPTTFTTIESVPLTHNGKLDKQALPEPEVVSGNEYVAPGNELEEKLCAIWQEVLGLEKVGIDDNFFRIGGDSITAIRLTAASRRSLDQDIPLALLFECKTIAGIAKQLKQQTKIVIPKFEVENYPLSFAQERLLFIERFEQGTHAYHISFLVQLSQNVNLSALKTAVNHIIERHPILKTVYRSDEQDKDYQQILTEKITVQDHISATDNECLQAIAAEKARPFDLANEPSMRLQHYIVGEKQYLLIVWHHIAFDGWSTDIFMQELSAAYQALCVGQTVCLPELDISYGDYAVWQRNHLQGETLEKLLNYWLQQLAGYETLELLTDHPRPSEIDYRGRNFYFSLDVDLSAQLRQLAKAQETTLYTVLLSGFYVTLATLSGQTDIIIGTPADNRHHAQTQSLIGFFVNSLVLRADIQSQSKVNALITQIHQVVSQALVHQELPFEKLVDALDVERDASRHPLYQVMFGLESFGESIAKEGGLPFELVNFNAEQSLYTPAKFDLSVFLNDADAQIDGAFNYALSLFDDNSIEQIALMYQQILKAFVANPMQSIAEIDKYSEQQRGSNLAMYQALNDTAKVYEQPATLIEKIFSLDKNNENMLAVVYQQQSYSYKTLDQMSNQIAHLLRAQGVQRNQLIGVFVERRIEFIPAILGVLKSGAAYVPIDHSYPQERIRSILSQCEFDIVISQNTLVASLQELASSCLNVVVCVDDFSQQPDQTEDYSFLVMDKIDIHAASIKHCDIINQLDDLAYVIFTSGSTGLPKGVQVTQQNIYNMSLIAETFKWGPEDKIIQFAPLCFDVSVGEIFTILSVGGQVHILPAHKRQCPQMYIDTVAEFDITVMSMTPSYFYQLVELAGSNKEKLSSVKTVVLGGEAVLQSQVSKWKSLFGDDNKLFNAYGPTETTVLSSYYQADKTLDNYRETLVMGKPVNNTQIYIIDEQQRLCAVNQSGEIIIGGDGVTKGYLKDEEKTAQVFIDIIDIKNQGEELVPQRYYKTGDLGRLLPNGNLEFLGRKDNQVKIRGFRVELGEIENALNQLIEIKQAVVIDRKKTGSQYLAAYIVLAADKIIDFEYLRTRLSDKLPDYMVPATFTMIESIPLTHNGKLDKRALPEPEFNSGGDYVAPESLLEETLCHIWQTVLGLEQVGVQDNFFRIGGDSISSIQLVAKLRRAGFNLQVKSIFDAPTVAQQARLLSESQAALEIIAEQGVLSGTFNLLPIQQWFFDKPILNPQHWNMAFMINIPSQIQQAAIEQGLEVLAQQHDMLRCSFEAGEHGYQQCYHEDISSWMAPLQALDVSDLDEHALHEQLTVWQSRFNFSKGPLWQVGHLTGYADNSARLFFAFHHLIIDAVSWRIIAEDMRVLLSGESLASKSSSYRQWVQAIEQYGQSHVDEVSYWQAVIADQALLPIAESTTNTFSISLTNEQTENLLQESNGAYHTEINDLLLSALARALHETFACPVNHIILEGHGREMIDERLDISQTVGWFTTTYPVQLINDESLNDTIIRTKEMLRAIPNKGIGFGAFTQAGVLKCELPEISFNYLGQLDSGVGKTETSQWQLVGEDCGRMMTTENTYGLHLNINGAVQDGVLYFNIVSCLTARQGQQFTDTFTAALLAVTLQCQSVAQAGGIKTPSDYGVESLSISRLRRLQQDYAIEAIFLATSLQEGFVYHHLSQPQDDAYRVQLLLDYHEVLNIEAYQQAWGLASLRYPMLRTVFDWDGQEILQVVTQGQSINKSHFSVIDISDVPEADRDDAIEKIQQQDRAIAFDLQKPGLLRFTLIKHHEAFYTVLRTGHHIVMDGWGGPVLLQVVHDYYAMLVRGETPQFELETAYLDAQVYYAKQRHTIDAYWSKAKLQFDAVNDINALLSNPMDLSQTKAIEHVTEQELVLSGDDYHDLKAMCQQQEVTLNVALQFAWHKLLHSYTQDPQTIVGTTVSGRDIPVDGIESSVGLYINTLPLVVDWQSSSTTAELLTLIQHNIAELNSFSNVSLSKLQSHGERLFHSLFVFENYPSQFDDNDSADGNAINNVQFRQAIEKTDYPLSIVAHELQNSLGVKLIYSEDYLDEVDAKRLLAQLQKILSEITARAQQTHQQISLMAEDELQMMLQSWNETDAPYPQDKTLPQLFAAQVEKTPNNIALVFEGEKLTFQQLNDKANQLAHVIRTRYQAKNNQSIQPDTLIALYLDRNTEMVVSILAVLKAGAAYVPLSPEYPQERTLFIVEDTQTSLIITQQHYMDQLTDWVFGSTSLPGLIAADDVDILTTSSSSNPESNATSRSLAYVIYTSGTTGQPKGVAVEHEAVASFAINNNYIDTPTVNRVGSLSPYSFDGFVFDTFFTLLNGASICLLDSKLILNADLFRQCLLDYEIDSFFTTTALFNELIRNNVLKNSKVCNLLFGGEKVNVSIVQKAQNDFPHIRIVHVYGPTETVVYASAYWCPEQLDKAPIGKPLKNKRFYVLDPSDNPVPINVPGELYIGGAGLAREYFNRPELTTERFVDNPFASAADKAKGYTRLYKTGDLVRWSVDGNIEFLGRNDSQVKIRGFRIELREIENVLNEYEEVKQALVIDCDKEGNKFLAAYLVSASDKPLDVNVIRESLLSRLPDYMVPSTFTEIDAIPLTVNGKLDKRALPGPEFVSGGDYLAPRNELEEKLCAIWQKVLGLKQVGVYDNFFRIGGNSILAIRLTAAIHRQLQIEIPLALLFEQKTVAGLAVHHNQYALLVIPKAEVDFYPLSFAQERLLFIERFEQGSDAYHIPYPVRLNNDVDLAVLETAFNLVIERHPLLKTVYRSDDKGNDYQYKLSVDVPIQSKEFNTDEELRKTLQLDLTRPFDLTQQPSIRLQHYIVDEAQYLLMLWHHIAFDGWSLEIFMRELSIAYQALCAGQSVALPPLDINYGDYALWQRNYLQGENLEKLLNYWQQQLSAYEILQLPTDYPRPAEFDYRGKDYEFALDVDLSAQLRELARQQETTLYTVLLSSFYVTLATLSGQTDILIGTPSDNRHHAQTQSLIGFFVNSLVLRAEIQHQTTIETLITQIHQMVRQALVHQELPFEKLVEVLNVEPDASRHPLYQLMFGVQDFGQGTGRDSSLPFAALDFDREENVYSPAKFDLSVFLNDSEAQINGVINYAVSLFSNTSIEQMALMYQQILKAFVANPKQSIAEIDKYTQAQRDKNLQMYQALNDTDKSYGQSSILIEKIFNLNKDNENNIAVAYEQQIYSYKSLDEFSNQIAYLLRAQGVQRNQLIGVFVERRIEFIPAILGILKSGAAYVPIDPDYPQERIQSMLDQCGFDMVISQNTLLTALQQFVCQSLTTVVCVDEVNAQDDLPFLVMDKQDILATPSNSCEIINESDDLAYVIFTSGSSGLPKGVQVTQRNIFNMSLVTDLFQWGVEEKIIQFAPLCFDVSVGEIFTILSVGAQVHILPAERRHSPQLYIDTVAEFGITVMSMTPSYFYQLIEIAASNKNQLSSVKTVVLGGEAVLQSQVNKWQAIFGDKNRIINAYGPTETTVLSSYHQAVATIDRCREMLVMGKPINNTQIYIVDEQLRLCQVNQSGEIIIGGDSVTKGYLNDEQQTAQVFINTGDVNISGKEIPDQRYYKTGDLGRLLPDGNLEFLGRKDNQVKIRGFRIELGEIENALNELPEVKQAVVIDRKKEGGQYLAAYMVSEVDCVIDSENYYERLSDRLPGYMVPATFTIIESIPLTHNGKLDQRALPEPEFISGGEYVAPVTATEKALVEIYARLLKLEGDAISVTANFFKLGGHSLLAVRLVADIRAQLQQELGIKTIFEAPAIRTLAEKIDLGVATPLRTKLIPVIRNNILPLSFAQQRLWFIDQLQGGSPEYNMPVALLIESTEDNDSSFNVGAAQQALIRIIDRHESLRTVFEERDSGAVQIVKETFHFTIPCHDLSDLNKDKQDRQVRELINKDSRKTFDLSSDLMLRASYLRLSSTEVKISKGILLFNMHHIASDGWSIGLLIKEFVENYQSIVSEETNPLLPLLIQYADYAHWQRAYLEEEVMEQQLAYWIEQFTDVPSVHSLPLDYPRPVMKTYEGASVTAHLASDLSDQLQQLAHQQNVTLFMLLHGALALVLSRHSNSQDIVIATPVANRLQAELEPLIGFFVNTLVLRTDTHHENFDDYLAHVRQVNLDAQANQDIPFEHLLEHCAIVRSTQHTPLFQIMFTMNTNEASDLSVPGFKISAMAGDDIAAKFDLEISANISDDGLHLSWIYDKSLFSEAHIQQLNDHYQRLLNSIIKTPYASMAELSLLSPQEIHYLVHELNDTATDYPHDQLIHELFEAQAQQTPNNIAVVFEESQLSYDELNASVNRLAHYLREQGVGVDTLVGICVERSLDMIIGILAIIKAGGAYVALDPEYPEARLHFIIADTGLKYLLTQTGLQDRLELSETIAVAALNSPAHEQLMLSYPSVNLNRIASQNDSSLAYVIYTSGSTGQPKGAMIEHRSTVALLHWSQDYFSKEELHCVLASTSLNFDLSVFELFVPISSGGQCLLVNSILSLMENDYENNQLTMINTVPSGIQALSKAEKIPSSVMTINLAGEPLTQTLVNELWHVRSLKRVVNLYGPSEDTTYSTVDSMYGQLSQNPSIGKPINNTLSFVLNDARNLVPVGSIGELYLGGKGLARGYLQQPELTNERFIVNPFSEDPQQRLYKTGDLVRYLPYGKLEFIGRLDDQVKIRGFRIELGEIASQLSQCENVATCLVLVREDEVDQKRLVAYVVAKTGEVFDDVSDKTKFVTGLQEYLQKTLPDYMLPSAFVILDEFPLMSNGKINKKALPTSDGTLLQGEYVAPETEIDKALVQIWAKLLSLNESAISITANFFELGGHSILATMLVTQVRQRLDCPLHIADVFQRQTIKEISAYINWGQSQQGRFDKREMAEGLLLLKHGESDYKPLFLVHPVGGYAHCYVELAGLLDYPGAIYGLQSTAVEVWTIEEMAANYISSIQTVQNQGRYFLGGWSMGGVVAYEIAQQFSSNGQQVDELLMIDSFSPLLLTRQKKAKSDFQLLGGLISELGISLDGYDKATLKKMKKWKIDQLLLEVLELGQQQTRLPEDFSIDDLTARFAMIQGNDGLFRQYRPLASSTKIHLIRARLNDHGDKYLGWDKFSSDVRVSETAGDHFTLISRPLVNGLAEIINKKMLLGMDFDLKRFLEVGKHLYETT